MPVETQELHDYVSQQQLILKAAIKAEFDEELRQHRHQLRNDMATVQNAAHDSMSHWQSLSQQLDRLSKVWDGNGRGTVDTRLSLVEREVKDTREAVTRVALLLEDRGTGSLPTRLVVLEHDVAEIKASIDAIEVSCAACQRSREEQVEKRQGTIRQVFLSSIPTMMQWIGLGVVILIWLAVSHGNEPKVITVQLPQQSATAPAAPSPSPSGT